MDLKVSYRNPAYSVEAFSGNALYYKRGMSKMDKLKTVSEVCAITGLTRKHLYYFHHENVVQAVAYSNYSVYGNDGYKLYDTNAVIKLQLIALYFQLGLKRNEIRDIMLKNNNDSKQILEHMLSLVTNKQIKINRQIKALKYLIEAFDDDNITETLYNISLEELGKYILESKDTEEIL